MTFSRLVLCVRQERLLFETTMEETRGISKSDESRMHCTRLQSRDLIKSRSDVLTSLRSLRNLFSLLQSQRDHEQRRKAKPER